MLAKNLVGFCWMNFIVRKETLLFLFISTIAALIVGNRGDTNDTQIYYDVFRYIDQLPLLNPVSFYAQTGMEVGFGWYSWLINLFTSSNIVLFTIFSFLNFVFIYKTCREIGIKYIYTFLIYISSSYFFMQQFMQMRQGLAICIVIYATICILKRGVSLAPVLLLLLSISLHQSSLLLIAFCAMFYFFRKTFLFSYQYFIRLNWVMFFSFVVVFKFLLLRILIGASSRLQQYSDSGSYNEEISLFSLPNIRTFLILMVLTYFSSERLRQNELYRLFLFLIFTALAIRIGFSEFAIMSGRLSTAFSYVEIFALSMFFINRFAPITRGALLLIYCALQLFIVLYFQAPYLWNLYFMPLHLY